MKIYKGIGAGGGAAVGRIALLKRREATAERSGATDAASERARLERAKAAAAERLRGLYDKTLRETGEESAAIFEIHAMLLDDEDYNDFVNSAIGNGAVAERAVAAAADKFAELFSSMEDEYMRERAADVRDVSELLLSVLSGSERTAPVLGGGVILCADDLSPSETAALDRDNIRAFVTARGSVNSHTAILARAMNIPAVVGAGDDFLNDIADGGEAAVDGASGEIFIDPDGETLALIAEKLRLAEENDALLQKLRGRDNVTRDGRKIDVFANVGSAEDIESAVANDAGGIGLFRSEFLFMGRAECPTEEEQLATYKNALERMAGRRVIVRTLDVGADKRAECLGLKDEENPALGCRAIRFCLSRPDVFKTQLRALYRASVYGRLGIMFPMITSVWELERALELCAEARAELRERGIGYSEDTELGIMIETPAAALISDRLAPMVDFFSVGTNDLTQYTLACDRQNPDVGRFIDPRHVAVLRLIEMSAENARKHGVRIGICGELGADTSLTETFLRMGIDELSVSPPFILKVRGAVRKLDLSESRTE